jgi:hypothetical protein
MNLKLIRPPLEQCVHSTQGAFYIDEKFYCWSLELPWKDNEDNVSCIPEGTYKVIVDHSESKQRMLPHILDVPSRAGIRVHVANFPSEIKGCISLGKIAKADSVFDSGGAFNPFFSLLLESISKGEECTLEIIRDNTHAELQKGG